MPKSLKKSNKKSIPIFPIFPIFRLFPTFRLLDSTTLNFTHNVELTDAVSEYFHTDCVFLHSVYFHKCMSYGIDACWYRAPSGANKMQETNVNINIFIHNEFKKILVQHAWVSRQQKCPGDLWPLRYLTIMTLRDSASPRSKAGVALYCQLNCFRIQFLTRAVSRKYSKICFD